VQGKKAKKMKIKDSQSNGKPLKRSVVSPDEFHQILSGSKSKTKSFKSS